MTRDPYAQDEEIAQEKASIIERAAQRLTTAAPPAPVEERDKTGPAPASTDNQSHKGLTERHSTGASERASKVESSTAQRITLDLDLLAERGFLTPESMNSRLGDETRLVKRAVLSQARASDSDYANVVVVTSAWPAEGKTFTAINLAMSLAVERDLHVLLVDADLAKPSILKTLGITAKTGLIDLLENPQTDVGDVIMRTNVPKLSIIGPGRPHDMSMELLASKRMQAVAGEISERYADRVIIFDSPPVLASTEATVMVDFAGQIIFVVEAERTRREAIEEAMSILGDACPIRLVLNKTRELIGGHTSKYYNYSYGRYGETEAAR